MPDSQPRTVLGIPVGPELLAKWHRWLAPELQPFPIDELPAALVAQLPVRDPERSDETRDSFYLYGGTWTWLTQPEFEALPLAARRLLHGARRRHMSPKPTPPWPSRLTAEPDLAVRWVEHGMRPSRHREVPTEVWARCTDVLPEAERLAGTFSADGSGPNCFGTVLAAAGVEGAEHEWTQLEEFDDWLAGATDEVRGTARDEAPGTVLVWHEHGRLAHAAVTIGGHWALSKPSQSWSSPRLIWSVRETILSWRFPGTRLSRHALRG